MRFAVTFDTIDLYGDLEQAGAERPVRLGKSQYRLLCLHQYKLLRKIPGSHPIGLNMQAAKIPPLKSHATASRGDFHDFRAPLSGSKIVDLCRRLRLKKSSRVEFPGKISVTDRGLFPHLYLCGVAQRGQAAPGSGEGLRLKNERD